MTNPCKIDARKSNARNIENDAKMVPKWRSKSNKNTWTNDTKKHHEKWCKNEAPKSHSPEWVLGPGVPEEVRSSSGDSRPGFHLASNILQKTNTQQTIKKQSLEPQAVTSHALDVPADTVRIYQYIGPNAVPAFGAQSAPPWRFWLSVFVFSMKNHHFEANNGFFNLFCFLAGDFFEFFHKNQKTSPARGLKKSKNILFVSKWWFFIENTKTESLARHGGADCAPVPGGLWAQYIDRSAPCLPARQVRAS